MLDPKATYHNPRIRTLPHGFIHSYDEPEYGITPAVYNGDVQLLNWNMSPRRGMTVDFHLREVGDKDIHPCKGMPCGPQYGQRMKIVASLPHLSDSEEMGQTIFVGEAVLMRWADDCVNGMMVRFLLDGGPDGAAGRHPFDGLAAGRRDGEPMVLVAWAIAENERPVSPSDVRRQVPFHAMNAVKQAHTLFRDVRFLDFLRGRLSSLVPEGDVRAGLTCPDENPSLFAKEVVRIWCGVSSLAEMNQDTVASERARARWRSLLGAFEDEVWGRR